MFVNDLIYDVGMHNGDDTAFYLARGFRVVAIEADPSLAAAGRERFRDAIRRGALTVLNVAVAPHDGEAEFWICDRIPEWNSFDRSIASRDGQSHHRIVVPTRRFGSVLREHGVPYYLKIDIEGSDLLCLADFSAGELPRYVSVESECLGASAAGGAPEGLRSLAVLHDLGYCRFKLIDQVTFTPHSDRPSLTRPLDRFGRQVLMSRCAGAVPGVSRLGRWLTYRGRLERRFGRAFPVGCSGAFSEDTPGRWMTFTQAQHAYVRSRQRHARYAGLADYSYWCDWHAALES